MISIVLSHIVQSGNPVNDILGDDFSPMAYLNEKSTIDVWEKQVRTTYEKTLSYQTDQRDDRTQQVAQKAVDYIEDNYMDNGLSVSMVAKALLINQTYLRSMFKEAHGSTISDFITKTRMNKAMGLLKEKRYMLADIADQVGYSDASYFSKCFKKYYGKSPSQYERTL